MKSLTYLHLLVFLSLFLPCIGRGQSFNPVTPALSFNVFTNHAVTFVSGHTAGPIATAGSLILAGQHDVCNNSAGVYPNGLGNAGNYGLVVNGRIYYNSGQSSKILSSAFLRLGNTTGTTLLDHDNNNASLNLRAIPSTGSYLSSTNYVTQSSYQAASSATGSNGINFVTAFSKLIGNSNIINNYNYSQSNSSTFNFATIPGGTGGTKTINIASGKVNYINITGSQLTAMSPASSNASYQFSQTLSSSTIVIFNVQDTGNYTWYPPNLASVNGSDGSFILWNFAALRKLDIAGSNSTYGTIFAPNTNVIKSQGNNAEGQIISDSASLAYGEVHYQVFAGTLPNGSTLPPAPGGGSNPGASSTPLPVKQLRLSAIGMDNAAQLSWDIIGASDLKELKLQASDDAAVYADIISLSIPQAGTTDSHGVYVDNTVHGKEVYYRIEAITAAGDQYYSNVASVHFSSGSICHVSPNPFLDRINIAGVSAEGDMQWTLYDAQGKSVGSGADNNNKTITNLGNLPSGNYFLQVTSGKVSNYFSLIKK